MNVLAGCDFFTVEVLTWRGLVTYYVLFFLHLESRRVSVAGITRHPDQEWMEQIGRSATQETWGYLRSCRYVLHDRDTKFCASFRSALATGGVKTIPLPARSPNLKDYASYCTSRVRAGATLLVRHRRESFTPCAFRGGLSPGCSYKQSFLSL